MKLFIFIISYTQVLSSMSKNFSASNIKFENPFLLKNITASTVSVIYLITTKRLWFYQNLLVCLCPTNDAPVALLFGNTAAAAPNTVAKSVLLSPRYRNSSEKSFGWLVCTDTGTDTALLAAEHAASGRQHTAHVLLTGCLHHLLPLRLTIKHSVAVYGTVHQAQAVQPPPLTQQATLILDTAEVRRDKQLAELLQTGRLPHHRTAHVDVLAVIVAIVVTAGVLSSECR